MKYLLLLIQLHLCYLQTKHLDRNFMVTPCTNNIQHFIVQLMHITLKNVELLKYFKIKKLLQQVSV